MPPEVYLLYGENEFEIAQFLSKLEAKLGDPGLAALNITRLDGRTTNWNDFLAAVSAVPFLTERRIVEYINPLARLKDLPVQQKFLELLAKIPSSTACVLVEYRTLTEKKDAEKGKYHWLEAWARENEERVFLRHFLLPKGEGMVSWIQERVKELGGGITRQAAEQLAELVGVNPRLADQEMSKLLTYVNYQRPVQVEDVQKLTAYAAQANIFAMTDALGGRDAPEALGLLHHLLEQEDPSVIFGMVVRQFRLLLLVCDCLDRGVQKGNIARETGLKQFVVDKLIWPASRFSMPVLEGVYHYLLDLDEGVKTGQYPIDLALEMFAADFTAQQDGWTPHSLPARSDSAVLSG